jgi:starch-binding outer membrane protein, SusD/RagB family
MKVKSILIPCLLLAATMGLNTSCSDMLTQDSDNVIYSDNEHLIDATDTLSSVAGIISKMQVIADRTVLLGELRGDLVNVNSHASSDLRDVSLFNINDSNVYNSPKDYYAVINNCNYFLAKADTALKNNRNEKIFIKEYAAVKAFRAWTYLQLVLNYGKVPFVTEPILSKLDAEKTYPTKDIQEICTYFIKDIAPYADINMPGYGTMRSNDSRLFFFPIYPLLGELNLWAGNYKEAALNYYKYIDNRTLYTGTDGVTWAPKEAEFKRGTDSYSYLFYNESYDVDYDILTMVPMDSVAAEGNYSVLRDLFNSTRNNEYNSSIVPSESMINLSASQKYCSYYNGVTTYAPSGLDGFASGDIRFFATYESENNVHVSDGSKIDTYQYFSKYDSRNVHIYRKTELYLHLAEALNRAGYPRFAFEILKKGLTNQNIQNDVIPYYTADSAWIAQFDFPNTKYITSTVAGNQNTQGVHSRGSGNSLYNEYYTMPYDSTITDSMAQIKYQIDKVEDLIMNENVLELSFEGKRYYDLMRVALRRNDPKYLADRIYSRNGLTGTGISKDLTNIKNWYMNWKNKIGY